MRAGILTPVRKEFVFHVDQAWMRKIHEHFNGIVLWNHVFFSMPADDIPDWLFKHELEHCYQQIREGRLRFHLKYAYYAIRYGYKQNPYEVLAYEVQNLQLQPSEEQALWNLRKDSQD